MAQVSRAERGEQLSYRFDSAETPFGLHTFNEGTELVNDPHAGPVAKVLKTYASEKYMQFYHVVFDATLAVRHYQQRLMELKAAELKGLQGLAGAKARVVALKAELAQQLRLPFLMPLIVLLRSFGRYDSANALSDLVSLGLAFMVFQGLMELFRLEVTDISGDEVFLVVLIGFAAVSVTFGIKSLLATMVVNRGLVNGGPVPFWALLRRGDSILYLSLVFVGIETAFASPYFISRLPLSIRDELTWRLSACMSAGMFAVVNVSLGVAQGGKLVREAGALSHRSGEPDSVDTLLRWRWSAYQELRQASEEVASYEALLERLSGEIAETQAALEAARRRAVDLTAKWQGCLNFLMDDLRQRGVPEVALGALREGGK